jgi:hypothetical protein
MNFLGPCFRRNLIEPCLNFHKVTLSRLPLALHLVFKWFLVLLAFNLIQGQPIWAQTVLDRLEQQIRQRVSPSQEGNAAYRSPTKSAATPQPPPAPSPDKPAMTDGVTAVYLGVTADDRKDRGRGVRITDVRPGGPGDKAGLRNQDLVTALTGVRVRQLTDMVEILRLYQPDDIVEFDILRDGTLHKIQLTLGRRPAVSGPISQTAEMLPLPPGELIVPESPPSKAMTPSAPSPVQPNTSSDREKIEQMQNRITELERQVADLERALSEARKNK